MAVTMSDIAARVGVSRPTVSDVLRGRAGKVKVSERTRKRILDVVKELNYAPSSVARALAIGKNHNIAFLLSSKTTLGIANDYFATLLAGVQEGCKQRGYNCQVDCYDLSSIKEFVMPSNLKSRHVDGVVISGYVEDEVVQELVDHKIPFILVGESTDFSRDRILSVSRDIVSSYVEIFEHLHSKGHTDIMVGGIVSKHAKQLVEDSKELFLSRNKIAKVVFHEHGTFTLEQDAFECGYEQAKKWAEMSSRPTSLVSDDKFCIGFLKGIRECGFSCPEEISVVSSCDTTLCQWFEPGITAVSTYLYENGLALTNLFIDFLEDKAGWAEVNKKAAGVWKDGELIIRSSTAKIYPSG